MVFARRTMLAEQTDEELLQLVSQKDIAAYEMLYDRHAGVIYSLIARVVRDLHVADELLQETFWQIWQNATQYQGRGPAIAWMMRIGRNRALDQIRYQKIRLRDKQTSLDEAETAPASLGAEHDAEQMWNRQHIRLALESLPYEQRLCIDLAYFDGMSQQEIADSTNLPLGTVKSRMRLGMEKLERILRSVGYP